MHPFLFVSIRRSLLLLVLLAVLPALAIVLYTGRDLRNNVVAEAELFSLRQVQAMAAHHEQVVANARLLLVTLARAAEVRGLDPKASQTLLVDLLGRNQVYISLALADPAGRIVAAVPAAGPADIGARPFFRSALTDNRFTVGDYTLREPEHRVVVEFAQPVVGDNGQPVGVLAAAFDLSSFGRIFYDLHLPEHSVFTLTDAQGTRLTRFPETGKYTWVKDLPQMIVRMSGATEEGTFLETGVDGIRRLYSYKRLHFEGAAFPYLMIRLGIPVEQALAEARAVVVRNVVLLVLAALLALATAWLVGERGIMRRLNKLTGAAGRLEAGDLTTRTGIEPGEGELGQLAAAFDSMAEGLERKEHERHQAAEELQRLNEELEQRVSQRTGELATANQELQTILENLRRAQGQLVLSEKLAALGGLVAGVAHEINTPVGVALSAGSTLAEKNRALAEQFAGGAMKRSDLGRYLDEASEGVAMMLVNLHRASDLIRSFKMVAVDQMSEVRRSFNMHAYIDEILLSLRPKLKKTSLRVSVRCPDDLVIESYPGAISQIITNWIINSLVHAFAPDQAGEVTIEADKEGDMLNLRYIDNGRGMAPEVRDCIFEPFFTTARGQGSTGLGLHIVFNIVTATLGGSISCMSEPGQGTSFHVTVPLAARTEE
ncbi:MAG: ATP-binding protein [Desulfobulbus sp.]|nr:ATP-binding protein [Desulfobulbus sp.]